MTWGCLLFHQLIYLHVASGLVYPNLVQQRALAERFRAGTATRNADDRVDFQDCSISVFERYDCGYYGIDVHECASRDCCWQESDLPAIPWCYHSRSNAPDTCIQEDDVKVDCGYYGINSEECIDNGCCWMPSDTPAAPWCFHPTAPTYSPDCGIPAIPPAVRSRIVGGVEATPYSWPWQVSLNADGHFCGGSLINERWVVSAAHCSPGFEWSSAPGRVVLGLHQQAESSAVAVGIEDIFTHEEYNIVTNDKDIMLIKLDRGVMFNDKISPVCMPIHGATITGGTPCYTTGWGVTAVGGDVADVLMQVMVPMIAASTCRQRDWYGDELTDNMLCAGYQAGGRDSCQGDSGGPLVCMQHGRWILAGVVSWGEGCARSNKPGIYTKVANFVDWIEDTMTEHW